MGGAMILSLAASLAFSRMLLGEQDPRIATLADAKVLLDMQRIVDWKHASGSG